MCSIAGIINAKHPVDANELKRMSDSMILRGPDDGNMYVQEKVGLAHRRLSIIDLCTGGQPMYSEDKQCVIVFNGEIYNYKSLRNTLRKDGIEFRTTSDTEVLLKSYVFYGIDKTLAQIEGMFAFAIYDNRNKKTYIARDRFGEKPLYYKKNKDSFKFASELKAFEGLERCKIDPVGLNLFISLSYIPAPYSIYEGVSKLLPGSYIEITEDFSILNHKYYDIKEKVKEQGSNSSLNYDEAKNHVRNLVIESVRERMISDVPMGAFLSGGIDSSIVCCVMNMLSTVPINTFSIGFNERQYDETERALLVSKHIGSNHTQFTLRYNDVVGLIDDVISYYDEPFGDSSSICSYYVAKLAREKVKVVLTGDAADEVFGGYNKYLIHYYSGRLKSAPEFVKKLIMLLSVYLPENQYTSTLIRKVRKVVSNYNMSEFDSYFNMLCMGCNNEARSNLVKRDIYTDIKAMYAREYGSLHNLSTLQKEQICDIKYVLEGDMFSKVDRACMHVSLENRTPFIDRKIVEYAMNLPDSYKIDGRNQKKILKDAFSDILPHETLKFSKSGFGVPVDYWLKSELKTEFEKYTSRDVIDSQELFDYQTIQKLINEHYSGKSNNKGILWNLYVFQKWYYNRYRNLN